MTVRVYLTDGSEHLFRGVKSVVNTSDFLRIIDSNVTEQKFNNDQISLLVVTERDIYTI